MVAFELIKVFYIGDLPEIIQSKLEKELSENFSRSLDYLELLVVDTDIHDLDIYDYFLSLGIKNEETIIIKGLNY